MMKGYLAFMMTLITAFPVLAESTKPASASSNGFETRCGWFSNPAPGNFSLYDRDGEWIIGVQGGHQVEGDWEWPKFDAAQWVKTNVNYGYGCACLEVKVDRRTQGVLAIRKTRVNPLQACRQDRALKKWKETFK